MDRAVRRTSHALTVALIVVLGSSLAAATVASSTAGSGAPSPSHAPFGEWTPFSALASARASLQSGAGPATGTPASCGSSSSGSVQCALSPAATPSANSPFPYSWTNLTSTLTGAPTPRVTAMTWDASDGYVLLFGGGTFSGVFSDTWTYSNGTWQNITGTVTGAPPSLAISAIAYDPSGSQVILFGGQNSSGTTVGYTWAYHARTWTNLTGTAGTAPAARIGTNNMVTDSTDNEIVLYGGNLTFPSLSDTWTFQDGKWKNVTTTAGLSSTVVFPVLSNDPAEHGVLMFGILIYNATHDVYRTGTYVYSAGAWKNLTATLTEEPAIPYLGAATYLSGPAAVVAVIPVTVNSTGSEIYFTSSWAFVNGGWENITTTAGYPPYVGLVPAITTNGADDTAIVFGGETSAGFSGATWVLSAIPTVTASATGPTTIDAGMSVSLHGTVSHGIAPVQEGWSFSSGASSVSGPSANPTFASAGTVVATFTATDLVGRNASESITIVVEPALTASVTVSPSSPSAGAGTAFAADVNGGAPPFTYSWTFGDGSTGTGAGVAHVYSGSGTYAVTVTVRDAAGKNVTATTSVSVGSSSLSLTSGTGLGLVAGIVVLAVIAALLGVLLMRKPKSPHGPPTPYPMEGAPPAAPPASPPPPG